MIRIEGASIELVCDVCHTTGSTVSECDVLRYMEQHSLRSDKYGDTAAEMVRALAWRDGWVNRRHRDYCGKCVAEGKTPGDKVHTTKRKREAHNND